MVECQTETSELEIINFQTINYNCRFFVVCWLGIDITSLAIASRGSDRPAKAKRARRPADDVLPSSKHAAAPKAAKKAKRQRGAKATLEGQPQVSKKAKQPGKPMKRPKKADCSNNATEEPKRPARVRRKMRGAPRLFFLSSESEFSCEGLCTFPLDDAFVCTVGFCRLSL